MNQVSSLVSLSYECPNYLTIGIKHFDCRSQKLMKNDITRNDKIKYLLSNDICRATISNYHKETHNSRCLNDRRVFNKFYDPTTGIIKSTLFIDYAQFEFKSFSICYLRISPFIV